MTQHARTLTTASIEFARRTKRVRGRTVFRHPHFSAYADALRNLVESLPSGRQVVGLTACRSGEGTTTIARNLAIASQAFGRRAALVAPKLPAAIHDGQPAESDFEFARLKLTLSRKRPADRSLSSGPLAQFRQRASIVFVDLPVVDELVRAPRLFRQIDALALVVSPDTPVALADEAVSLLSANAPLAGIIVNHPPTQCP